eukprot:2662295-Rhodomonas_salina.3
MPIPSHSTTTRSESGVEGREGREGRERARERPDRLQLDRGLLDCALRLSPIGAHVILLHVQESERASERTAPRGRERERTSGREGGRECEGGEGKGGRVCQWVAQSLNTDPSSE